MVGVGGQHPAATSMKGCRVKRSGWSPTFDSVKIAVTVLSSFTSPKSNFSRSTFRLGRPFTSTGTSGLLPSLVASH